MTEQDLLNRRSSNQQLIATSFNSPGELVHWLGAMQAQDYAGSLWSIGLRLPDMMQQDVEAAIVRKEIVRTWPMRGTLHFVASEDVRWMLKLMTPRIIASAARRHEQLGLDERTFARSFDIFAQSLQGDKQLMRKQLMAELERHGVATTGQRGYHLLWRAAQAGLICLGPLQGKQQTFVLLDEWLPPGKELDREAALAEIALRYFTSHGPATLKDFVWWTGLPAKDAREGLESIKRSLHKDMVAGLEYWSVPASPSSGAKTSLVRLLPGFDEYMLGYTNRDAIISDKEKYMPPLNGMFPPTVLIDGRVTGLWRRTIKAKHIELTLQPFGTFSTAEMRGIEQAAEQYGRFISKPVKIVT